MNRTRLRVDGWGRSRSRQDVMMGHQLAELAKLGCAAVLGPPSGTGVDLSDRLPPSAGESAAMGVVPADPGATRDVLYLLGDLPGASPLSNVTHAYVAAARRWPLGLADLSHVGLVVPSRWSRERLLEQGVASERISIVPHGVDAVRFCPLSPDDRVGVRAHFGYADDEVVFFAVVNDGTDGGLDLLLKAFARLRRDGLRLRLMLHCETAASQVDVDEVVRAAAADEPALLSSDVVAGIGTLSGPLDVEMARLLHGMADCYVSPRRATAFDDPVLEAIAVGVPVIVTRGGAADDICDDDVAWRISGIMRDASPGSASGEGRVLEPDVDELTDALGAVARGRGFDRTRFGAARMALLKRFTWRRSALHLGDALGIALPEGIAGPSALTGPPQPAGDRFSAPSPSGIPVQRRAALGRVRCRAWNALSLVVQGPCLRETTDLGAPPIDEALASIRHHFPGAQIVVSTWVGSDVDGLDADDIVLSPDPGPHVNNVNRQITSTTNGLAAATRPFAIKTRNDIVFHSDGLARKDLSRAGGMLSLERRIWAEANRIESSLRPFHPSDIIQFGTTEDLRRLWNVPAVVLEEAFLPGTPAHPVRPASEQAIFLGYLRGIGIDVRLESTFDTRYSIVAASVLHMLAAFDVFDAEEEQIALAPKFRKNPARIRLMESRDSFESLRAHFAQDPEAACRRVHDGALATIERLRAAG